MKKLIALLVVLVLAFACVIGMTAGKPAEHAMNAAETAAEAEAAEAEAAEAEAPADVEIQRLDYDAIYALHQGDEVVMTVAGEDITWDEYFQGIRSNGMQIEDYFEQMAMYYGEAASWEGSVGDGSGMIFADYPIEIAESNCQSYAAATAMAKERNVTLSETGKASLEPEYMAAETLGEGASVEELEAALDEQLHMTLTEYQRMAEVNILLDEMRNAKYGAEGELAEEAEVIAYLQDANYTSANHILLMTMDPNTGDELDEAAAAEKKEKADEIYAELSAITDTEELVKRFKELKAEYCEDGGAAAFPDGYTYIPNTMVAVFEDTANSLEDYGLSEPVKSDYGWHIILRMPLSAESLLYSSGEPSPARLHYAYDTFSEEFQQFVEDNAPVYAEGFEKIDLLSFRK